MSEPTLNLQSTSAQAQRPKSNSGKSKARSVSSGASRISSMLARTHAKAEAAKAGVKFAIQEANLRKQQAALTEKQTMSAAQTARIEAEIQADLDIVKSQRHAAESAAEVVALQSLDSLFDPDEDQKSAINVPSETPMERTQRFVEQHSSPQRVNDISSLITVDEIPAEDSACQSGITGRKVDEPTTQTHNITPVRQDIHSVLPDSSLSVSGNVVSSTPYQGGNLNPHAPSYLPSPYRTVASRPTAMNIIQQPSVTTELSQFLLKKDLLLTRLTRFDDKPESFSLWKSSFIQIMRELGVTVTEELDLLIKWLGPESARQAQRIRTANVRDPVKALQRIWDRLQERYGSPEMVEAALKAKLENFPKLTNKEPKKLYDLADILSEMECIKEDPSYKLQLSYLDSSSGVIPIVNKLPYNLQEKWTNQASKYKKRNCVSFRFPPFHFFVDFVKEISLIRNDPSFVYESTPSNLSKREKFSENISSSKPRFSAKKTEIDSLSRDTKQAVKCPLHKSNHTLNQCRGFRAKSLVDRRSFLKENRICFRCCDSASHMSRNCKESVSCVECGSDKHPSALHVNETVNPPSHQPITQDGGEQANQANALAANLKCTQICRENFCGKSCSKTILVNIYPSGCPEKSLRTYIILDDQSNVSLARTSLFDYFKECGPEIPYTLTSCSGQAQAKGRRANGYIVESLDGANTLHLPVLLECNQIPDSRNEIPTPQVANYHPHLREIASYIPTLDDNAEILLLIGRDIPDAHHVLDQHTGPGNSPFAQRLPLGWVIVGETCLGKIHKPEEAYVKRTHILENGRPSYFPPCISKLDVQENNEMTLLPDVHSYKDSIGSALFERSKNDNKLGLSIEDRQFLDVMDKGFQMSAEGKWVAPLPFKNPRQRLPGNKPEAVKRAKILHHSLMRNPVKKGHFIEFMQRVFDNDHAEHAPPLAPGEEHWYLPLFGVYHPQKPEQIRGVFDSSAKCNGISLNDVLLKGPDLTNNLLGVLLRFRKESVAIMADIQSMFHCFLVQEDQRNFLRFLWYEDNKPENSLIDYRMRVHVFGNKPSPAVASYGLHKAVNSAEGSHGKDVKDFVEKHFYVDDGLTSLPSKAQAISLLQRTQNALQSNGNLRLHKIASNSAEVIQAFPSEDHAKEITKLDLHNDNLPIQRSLGLVWDMQEDAFTFRVSFEEKAYTRRGVLSTISSLFDPVGFAAPITVQGKILLRELMTEITDWDEPLSSERKSEWDDWKTSLRTLDKFKIPRTYSHISLSEAVEKDVFVFSDASQRAIAAAAYIRTTDRNGDQSLRFVLGKSKVAPSHGHTIPRLELCGAVLAVEIAEIVSDCLEIDLNTFKYFTDSKVVLGYLRNQSKRFLVYVSNRVQRILQSSNPDQWGYVPTQLNPADVGTRPLSVQDLATSAWLLGPTKLPDSKQSFPETLLHSEQDQEILSEATSLMTTVKPGSYLGSGRFSRFSSWTKLVEAIARLQHIAQSFQKVNSCTGWHICSQSKTVQAYSVAEQWIVKQIQLEVYGNEIQLINQSLPLPRSSSIYNLDPFLDSSGLLRVGGRLKCSQLHSSFTNPIIIPGKSHTAVLLVRHYHNKVKHQGRSFTEGAVREAGLWIVGCKRLINSIIHKCFQCRKLRAQPCQTKMANLPVDRLTPAPAFTFVGVDAFGPWHIITRRTRGGMASDKRWAILFTCMSSRAVHIEVVEQMTSSCFINALKRFQAIRGKATQFRSDRGTNFTGATKDLQVNAINVEDGPVGSFLYNRGVKWIFNPPHSSHMGGSWERMIGISKRILESMLSEISTKNLTHEVLVTFMLEVCAIINNRPLVPVSSDPDNPHVLTPNMILTQKTNAPIEPLDHSDIRDLYRAQWKRVQHLAEQFWTRWRKEYLHTLQPRRKWQHDQSSIKQGDVILLKDKNVQRNEWPMGIITDVIPGEDGRIRKVRVKVSKGGHTTSFIRPITELILLTEA